MIIGIRYLTYLSLRMHCCYYAAATNLLHDIDKEVQSVVKDIMQHQNDAAGGAPGLIRFGQDMPTLLLDNPVRGLDLI